MRRALPLLAGAIVAALVATPVPASAKPSPEPSAGCDQPPHAPGVTTETVTTAEGPREFRLAIPEDYTGEKPLPLILNFHGLGSNAEQQAVYSQLEEKGPERGFIVITPQGGTLAGFRIWNILPGLLTTPDDLAFTTALLDNAEATLCVDTRRIYSTGMSNGGGMSVFLGCTMGERFAALAPVAGVNLVFEPCAVEERLPVLAFHGQVDGIVPYYGGPIGIGILQDRPLPPVEQAVADWAVRDGCKATPKIKSVSEHVQLFDYSGCDAKTDVQLYAVSGGGHTWPGAVEVGVLGETTQEISAADLILKFFDKHRRPKSRA